MKVKKIETERITNPQIFVKGVGFESIRLILESDNMGFGLHKTIIPKGGPYHWHYKNHLEACFCVKGLGKLINLDSKDEFIIEPDSVYILDKNDDHTFEAIEDTILISIFNPPVKGLEVHKEDGSY